MKACVCVWSVQSSWLCVCGLLPLCDEVQMRAVVPYARHQGHRGASRREGWMEKCVDHDHGRLCTWHYPPLASSFDWRPSTFTGYAATLCVNRAALDSHIQPPCFVSRLSSSREALRGDSDRKHRLGHWPFCCRLLRGAWVRVLFPPPPLIQEMLAWLPREHISVRRARSWTRRRLWPRAALGDQISCLVMDSPYAPRTVTGSASSCTGAVTWAGVTVSL